jgi:hypothetical protein
MYSMMWPMWKAPLAYGRAVVTNSLRVMVLRVPGVTAICGARREGGGR